MIQVILAIIPAAIAGGFGVYLFQKEKIKNIEQQLSSKKYEVYTSFIKLIYDMQKSFKTEKPLQEKYKIDIIYQIKTNLIIYGSDDVVKAFFEWEKHSQNEANNVFHYVGKVFEEIRKDMGNPKTFITAHEIKKNFHGYNKKTE